MSRIISNHSKLALRKNIPIAQYSTFGIGGRAEYFYWAKTPAELMRAIHWAKYSRLPWCVFAGGSNVVFPDTAMAGLLIRFFGGRIEVRRNRLVVDAGVPLAQVIQKAVTHGLRGLETLSGIPGTVGGAVVGNAGAYGHSISEVVEKVLVWDGRRQRWLSKSACRFGYRQSVFKSKPYVLLRVQLRFARRDAPAMLKKISSSVITLRRRKYQSGLKCPGSFFKNVLVSKVPKKALLRIDPAKIIEGKIPAGYILETVGAKNMRYGGVQIADFHANLFLNRGRAKAREVKHLAEILKKRVYKKFGIELEEEIRYF